MKLFKNAVINTVTSGVITNGSILVENGLIKDIGKDIKCDFDCEIIDLEGKTIYPGFIDGHSHLGLNERAIGKVGQDGHDETFPAAPELRAFDGINPHDDAFDIAIRGGITTAIISPSSGIGAVIAGTMSAVKTKGDCIDEMIVDSFVGMRGTMGPSAKFPALIMPKFPSSRTSVSAVIRELLLKSKQYMLKKEAGIKQAYMISFENMIPVLKQEVPLVIHANLKEDIFTAIRIAKEYNVKLVLLFVAEGHLVAKDLAKEGIDCLVGPVYQGHTRPEYRYHSKKVAAELAKHGVRISLIANSGNGKSDSINVQAALAIAQGLDEKTALKAITINVAKIFNLDKCVGSLEVGKHADFLVTEGRIFSRDFLIGDVYILGEKVN
jgi:imidazolonepropionase-like amidohydrolase